MRRGVKKRKFPFRPPRSVPWARRPQSSREREREESPKWERKVSRRDEEDEGKIPTTPTIYYYCPTQLSPAAPSKNKKGSHRIPLSLKRDKRACHAMSLFWMSAEKTLRVAPRRDEKLRRACAFFSRSAFSLTPCVRLSFFCVRRVKAREKLGGILL